MRPGAVFRLMTTALGQLSLESRGPRPTLYWRRVDDGSRDGYAELEKGVVTPIAPGQASAMVTGQIHSVANETDETTISLHIYGKHVGFVDRSQFDPETHVQGPFQVAID